MKLKKTVFVLKCTCNGYATDVVLQAPSEVSGKSSRTGFELTTSGFPSATTTNYAKEKLAIR